MTKYWVPGRFDCIFGHINALKLFKSSISYDVCFALSENISGSVQTAQPRSRIIAFVLSLLKMLERIDNSVTDRYSVIADLYGYAERFVFDLLRKAYLFVFLDAIYILFADASTTAIPLHNL